MKTLLEKPHTMAVKEKTEFQVFDQHTKHSEKMTEIERTETNRVKNVERKPYLQNNSFPNLLYNCQGTIVRNYQNGSYLWASTPQKVRAM